MRIPALFMRAISLLDPVDPLDVDGDPRTDSNVLSRPQPQAWRSRVPAKLSTLKTFLNL
jgi:hypothetical protein